MRYVRHARAVMYVGIATSRWRGKRSRYSRRMHNPHFYVSGKRPIFDRRKITALSYKEFYTQIPSPKRKIIHVNYILVTACPWNGRSDHLKGRQQLRNHQHDCLCDSVSLLTVAYISYVYRHRDWTYLSCNTNILFITLHNGDKLSTVKSLTFYKTICIDALNNAFSLNSVFMRQFLQKCL